MYQLVSTMITQHATLLRVERKYTFQGKMENSAIFNQK